MLQDILYYVYCFFILLSSIVILWKFQRFDFSTRIIAMLILVTFCSETLVKVVRLFSLNHRPIYHFYSVISFSLITIYFIYLLGFQNKALKSVLFSVLIVLAGLINCLLFQPLTLLNSNILICKSFFVAGMSMYSLYRILLDERIKYPERDFHFWFWALFLLLNCGTFFFWATLKILNKGGHFIDFTQTVQTLINIIVYGGIFIIFFKYPKNPALVHE